MRTNQRLTKKKNVTPGKLILIGVLAAILIAVIASQVGSSSTDPQASSQSKKKRIVKPTRTRRASPTQTQPVNPQALPSVAQPQKDWPVKSIAEVIAHDPFALPPSLLPTQTVTDNVRGLSAGPTTDQEQGPQSQLHAAQQQERELARQQEVGERLSELGEKGVAMVFLGAGEPVARIGTQDVRVGDVVNGLRIAEIRRNGTVVVEYADDDR